MSATVIAFAEARKAAEKRIAGLRKGLLSPAIFDGPFAPGEFYSCPQLQLQFEQYFALYGVDVKEFATAEDVMVGLQAALYVGTSLTQESLDNLQLPLTSPAERDLDHWFDALQRGDFGKALVAARELGIRAEFDAWLTRVSTPNSERKVLK